MEANPGPVQIYQMLDDVVIDTANIMVKYLALEACLFVMYLLKMEYFMTRFHKNRCISTTMVVI